MKAMTWVKQLFVSNKQDLEPLVLESKQIMQKNLRDLNDENLKDYLEQQEAINTSYLQEIKSLQSQINGTRLMLNFTMIIMIILLTFIYVYM